MFTVLLVDDSPAVREALRWALEDAPDLVVVGEAGDGDAALALAAELRPDAVLLDIEIPGPDGYAVARALKAGSDPPVVVFLSVHSAAPFRQRAREAGGDAFVEKSLGWSELLSRLRQVLADRRR